MISEVGMCGYQGNSRQQQVPQQFDVDANLILQSPGRRADLRGTR